LKYLKIEKSFPKSEFGKEEIVRKKDTERNGALSEVEMPKCRSIINSVPFDYAQGTVRDGSRSVPEIDKKRKK
jgi:hypothetical protein